MALEKTTIDKGHKNWTRHVFQNLWIHVCSNRIYAHAQTLVADESSIRPFNHVLHQFFWFAAKRALVGLYAFVLIILCLIFSHAKTT